jgi:hypothetical protein
LSSCEPTAASTTVTAEKSSFFKYISEQKIKTTSGSGTVISQKQSKQRKIVERGSAVMNSTKGDEVDKNDTSHIAYLNMLN